MQAASAAFAVHSRGVYAHGTSDLRIVHEDKVLGYFIVSAYTKHPDARRLKPKTWHLKPCLAQIAAGRSLLAHPRSYTMSLICFLYPPLVRQRGFATEA